MLMNTKDESQNTVEVVEQLEELQIDLSVVRWAAGEGSVSPERSCWLQKLRRNRGSRFYSDLIFVLLGRRSSASEAPKIWQEFIAHRELLTQKLGRNPGIVVAALDRLSNIQQDNKVEWSLIESDRLENILERAVVDGLTGLYDHDTFLVLLDKEIERAKRHSEKSSLLLLDLDDFKQINDQFGHQKGDEVLVQMAHIMRKSIRAMDYAGRYGGEEFAVILPETDIIEAIQSAERLRQAVENQFSQNYKLTISIGVACFPEDASEIEGLVKLADEAMYYAKATGKNRVISAHDIGHE
jgi:diguanylate cyclase (GGDEF)-like protein